MARRGAKGPKTERRRRAPAPRGRAKSTAGKAAGKTKSAGLARALREALEREAAASEVLKVIANSPGELGPVFNAMLENATRLCEAKFGTLFRFDGELLHRVASTGTPRELVEFQDKRGAFRPATAGGMITRMFREKALVHVIDEQQAPEPSPPARYGGARSCVAVPMLKDKELVGAFVIYRQEVRAFTDKQIELVQNFAAQAVIAIENTRLLSELRHRTDDLSEALKQQTATSEVLQVINSSPGVLQPVFEAMLDKAMDLCEAAFGILWTFEDDRYAAAALRNVPEAYVSFLSKQTHVPRPGTAPYRILHGEPLVHNVDLASEESYRAGDPGRLALVDLGGARTALQVSLRKEKSLLGVITIYRQEVRPFDDKQIELIKNFAAQAVIAFENTRLLNELRQRTDDLTESLEQQTATSEVLSVISSSPGELEPVFQAMLQHATRICGAKIGILFRYQDGAYAATSKLGVSAEYAEYLDRGPIHPGPTTGLGRVARTKQTIHIEDTHADPAFAEREPFRMATAQLGRARSLLNVPMLKEGELIGAIGIYRQEVRPFTDKQIELVTNFAAQAVIAIENTRLLNELRQRTDDLSESLEQQTATSEVLEVISSSPGELEPVFRTMLEHAVRICGAKFGTLHRFDGEAFQWAGSFGTPPAMIEFQMKRGPFLPEPGNGFHRMMQTKEVMHVADATTEKAPGVAARLGGARSMVHVPMLKDDELVGAIIIYRQEILPFTGKQIELVQNFAAQAVIAIENTRLLNELRQSLEQQTATADVLKVISRSTFDLQTVLDTLIESAARLCHADKSAIRMMKDGLFHNVASHGYSAEQIEWLKHNPYAPDRASVVGRVMLDGETVHVADAQASTGPDFTGRAGALNVRTLLGVPLLRQGAPIGALVLMRNVVQPFTDQQVELVTTFADQAVIALENVRLFEEIQDKSRQLAEASQHKSQFLANMSHELRTPLNAILGYTELIADGIYGAPPEKMLTVLKRVESNGRHLLGLINAVLDLSKIEAGQLVIDLADYSLKDIVQTVCTAVEPLAADKKLALNTDISTDLPSGRGDERRLTQVLLNLVGNAIKFTDAGEVVIKASASNGSFDLSVRDTGPGISAADQAKLFQEFQQADNSTTRKKGGTGLGLAISRRIVEMHGGRIWVESEVGRGSVFFVTLPVQAQAQT